MLRNAATLLLAVSLAACGTGGGTRSEGGDTASGPGKGQTAAEINVSLGQAYLEQGRLELALDKLKKALKLDPKLSSAHTVIAVVYERINDPAQAQFHYKRAAELAPKNGPALNNYGTFLCRSKQYADADKYFARALADPFYQTPATAHANRGSCAMLWGDLDLAEKSLREAVRLQPNSAQALYDMARVLHARKDDFKARAFVQRCEAAAGASPELLELAMQIEQGLGNERGVREYRMRLKREFPDSSQAQSIANSEASR
jgi:type IV pilus assembly protein PilF